MAWQSAQTILQIKWSSTCTELHVEETPHSSYLVPPDPAHNADVMAAANWVEAAGPGGWGRAPVAGAD